jgi:hypothetical protein
VPSRYPSEGERAIRAASLGALLGIVLALIARWRRAGYPEK